MNLFFTASFKTRSRLNVNSKAKIPSRLLILTFTFFMLGFCQTSSLSANDFTSTGMCNDVTNGGTIFTDEVGCGDPYFDPSIIVGTSPATGGSGALEYLWMSTTDDINGNTSIWNIITGSSGENFDPPIISQTTSYRRCARREGCTLWITESNIVTIELNCNLPDIGNTVFNDVNQNGIQDAGELGVPGIMVKLLDPGADGVFGTGDENIIETVTTDSNGQYLFENVDPGTYIIEFMSNSLPDGFVFTTQNVGDDAIDSDADANGQTDPFTVNFGDEDDLTFDAGISLSCTLQINAITGVNPSCNPGNTGIVALSVMGGIAPITYIWSNGQTTEDISNLPAGDYCVTISDSAGCTLSDCVTLTAPDPITVSETFTPATCGQNNGSIDLTVNGGTGPYTYVWNTGATTQDLSNLAPGTYCVEIIDNNGCSNNDCFVINESSNVSPVTINGPGFLCPGESINFSAISTGAVSYAWTATGGSFSNPNTQNTAYTMMIPGTYTLTLVVINAEGCESTESIEVVVYETITLNGSVSDANCGANDGAINLTLSSGIAPFTFDWSNGQTTQNISGLAADTYCVTVNDAVGCDSAVECFSVGGSTAAPITISGANFICPGEIINLTAMSADAIAYDWTASGGILGSPAEQSTTWTMMIPGDYIIMAASINAQGCSDNISISITVNELVQITEDITNTVCGESNGSIDLTPISGTAPYTYIWSTSATTQGISNLPSGQYCATITDSNGCENSECYIVQSSSNLAVSLDITEITCNALGSLTAQVNGGLAPFTYAWNTGQTTGTIADLGADNYCVTVTDTNGCQSTQCITLDPVESTVITGAIVNPTCEGNNGSITTSLDPSISVTYIWSTGQTTPNLTDLAEGTYSVTVTSTNGCTSVETFTLISSGTLSVDLDPINPSCEGMDNGIINSSFTYTGSGSLMYTWNTGATTPNIENLPSGDYCVTVNSTDGCTATECVTLNSELLQITEAITNTQCGESNGSINVTPFSGTAPYTYIWSTGATTQGISNLPSGQYCVAIKDSNGCTNSECYLVQSSSNLAVNLDVIEITCNALGSLTAQVNGGLAPFTYAWNTGQTTGTIADLGADNYCVTVTDTNGCQSTQCITLDPVESTVITGAIVNPTCEGNNGSITTSLDPSISVTYIWSTGQTTPNLTDLAEGTYSVTVTSTNGCTSVETFTLISSGTLSVDLDPINPSCEGMDNGIINSSFTYTGSGSLMYTWNTGATTPNIENLPSGDYCVTVNSTDGCVATECVTLTSELIQIAENITNTLCGESNGSIDISPISGTAPYTYIWSTGATTQGIFNLSPGQYCVTITDSNGCENSECYMVQSSSNLAVSFDVTELTCNELGSLTAQVNGGLAPFTYAWNTGQTTGTIADLGADNYCVTVTDTNGCQSTQCITLDPVESTVITGAIVNPTCEGNNGSITTSLDPSISVTYIWSTGQTTPNLTDLAEGTYSVTVTSTNGCTSVETFTLISSGTLSVDLDPINPSCEGMDNGIINSSFTYTGSGSLMYTWNTGATTPNIENLPSGDYCVTVNSTDGCVATECVTLTAPDALTSSVFISSATCEASDGKIKLTPSGGTAPYGYKWSNGANTVEIDNLAPGEYCVTICDANGCIFEGCYTILGGMNVEGGLSSSIISCNGGNDGSASYTPNGGGTAPFTYSWNTGETTSTINNLPAGTYCVTVTDVFGCSDNGCINIANPAPLTITASGTNTSCGENNGSASVAFNFNAVSVSWTGQGLNATTNSIDNLSPGTYTVKVISESGCVITSIVVIDPSTPLEATIAPMNSTICPGETVILTGISNTGGTSFAWTATGGSFSTNAGANTSYTMMTPGMYTITLQATNAAGCVDTETVTITVRNDNDAICNPNIDLVSIGDFVWFDINNNGIQDSGELGIEGIEVKLMTAGPDGLFYTPDDVLIITEVTDPSGYYLFENVAADEYIIMFCNTLPNTEYTSLDTGGNDELDSDANPLNGKTDPFTVVSGQIDDLSFDAGIILTPSGCDNITNAGDICCDQMICGAGSLPELISSTMLPSGGSGAIEYIWMSSTIPGPLNMNTWTIIPGATSASYQPGPLFQTTFIARCARRVGCTNYLETDIIKLELAPAPVVTINSLPAFICLNETDMFNATDAGPGATYTWNLGDGANPATATGQFLTGISWSTTGEKTITITTTRQGCTFELARTVFVGDCINDPTQNRFIEFTALPIEESMDVDLNWNTNKDMNDFHFVVEHSIEGDFFDIIYTMDGEEAYQKKQYNFVDELARPGRNYYRIKHINNNGQVESSETVMVILSNEPSEKFILFPNPTVDFIIFESTVLTDEEGLIMILDMKGAILEQIVIPPNTERMHVDVNNLSPGAYTFFTKYGNIKSLPQIIFKSER